MSFKKFTGSRSPGFRGEPTMTIYDRGMISFGRGVLEKYLKGFNFVHLFYEEETKKIGIKPVTEDDGQAFRVKLDRTGKTGNFSCRTFLDHFKIDWSQTRKYKTTWNEKTKMIEVSIELDCISQKDLKK